jgi:hypothetical protein
MDQDRRALPERIELFKRELIACPANRLCDLVRKFVFGGTPFAFRHNPELGRILKRHLCSSLQVSEANLTIIGSAKTGFSLSPDGFPRPFHDGSDIDVLVVDHTLFDKLWRAILEWNYPRRREYLPDVEWRWRKARGEDLYWGWFRPHLITPSGFTHVGTLRPLRDISTRWFNAFRGLGQYSEFASRDVSGRLYRSWEHAVLYHTEGFRLLANLLRT